MNVLIDGDILVYRCGFAAQKTYYMVVDEKEVLPPSTFNSKADAKEYLETMANEGLVLVPCLHVDPLEYALQNADTVMGSITGKWPGATYFLWLSGEGNYRNDIAKTLPYKGNRDPEAKPQHYAAIREHLKSVWGAQLVNGMEADDAIGIAATNHRIAEQDFVIVSIDKDLDMLPGWHYNWVTKDGYYMDPVGARRKFYMQLLTGDRTDNIPGLPGIGPVKAAKILEGLTEETDLFLACRKAYEEKGYEYMLEQARLLWIRTRPDEIWMPPRVPHG